MHRHQKLPARIKRAASAGCFLKACGIGEDGVVSVHSDYPSIAIRVALLVIERIFTADGVVPPAIWLPRRRRFLFIRGRSDDVIVLTT